MAIIKGTLDLIASQLWSNNGFEDGVNGRASNRVVDRLHSDYGTVYKESYALGQRAALTRLLTAGTEVLKRL